MKYILRLCGSKLEKCDFSNLLSVNKTEEIVQILKFLHNNQLKAQNHTNINNVTSNNTVTPILRKEIPIKNTFIKKNNLRNDYKFKQSKILLIKETDLDFEKVEKELKLDFNSRVPESQDVSLDTDYLNFMENPSMEQYLNNYYYSSGTSIDI